MNELYKSYNTNQFPFVVLDLQIPSDAVDVNVSPDKREIFVHSENNLIEALKVRAFLSFSSPLILIVLHGSQKGLERLYEPSRSTYLEQNIQTPPRPSATVKKTNPLISAEDENEEQQPELPAQTIDITQSIERIPSTSLQSQRTSRRSPLNTLPTRSRSRSPITMSAASHSLAPRPAILDGLDRPVGILQGHPQRSLPATYFSPTPKETLEYDEGEDGDDGFSQDEEVRLILDESRSVPPATSKQPTKRLLQTTLSDVIKRGNTGNSTTSRDEPSANNVSARAKLRGQIAGFASQGAVIELDELDSDSDSDRSLQIKNNDTEREPGVTSQSPTRENTHEVLLEDDDDIQITSPTLDTPRRAPPPLKAPIDQDDIVMGTQESTLIDDSAPHIINNDQYILRGQDEDMSYLADSEPSHGESLDAGHFRNEILKPSLQGEITIRCDIRRIRARAKKRRMCAEAEAVRKKRRLDDNDMLPDAGIANADTAQVDRVLSRVIGKEDFEEMVILGQFNMAFIIARRSKPAKQDGSVDDIFIIGKEPFPLLVDRA